MEDTKKLSKALNKPTIINQPRSNKALGLIADMLYPATEAARMLGTDDTNLATMTGMDGAQSLIDDMSYGAPLVRGGSLQTSTIDPRLADVAAITPLPAAGIKKMINLLRGK